MVPFRKLNSLTYLLAYPHRNNSKPGEPSVDENFVPLAYRDRQSIGDSVFHQPAMNMQRVETVLNI
jgi:hypothetical protein